ncbi:hypothetical protein GCK72_007215 [Caenorhabditis remanei]|uniref:Uncharacterized protein n=1 Tax=Caenorhabditis remanei TaxID=31234 RepID=E3MIX9_CAERE|nr:hypothetical protein GCK72_007215 [Caenorhabditis remanei]EFP03396.1 hypothetical protein CRE_09572 [Caenorhabditis remanei]KAF1767256.1 hypothetical protein GCK72_007215 [Caenorhabditis remanei]
MTTDNSTDLKKKMAEQDKLNDFAERTYHKLAQVRHTIMIDMIPMKSPTKPAPIKKVVKPKSPGIKSPTEKSPLEKVTSPTTKTNKKNAKKYAPLMAKIIKDVKSDGFSF